MTQGGTRGGVRDEAGCGPAAADGIADGSPGGAADGRGRRDAPARPGGGGAEADPAPSAGAPAAPADPSPPPGAGPRDASSPHPPGGPGAAAGARPPAKARRRGLNRLSGLRRVLVGLRREWCVRVWGMDIHPTVQMSLSAKLDRTFPIGVHVGAHSYLAFESRILTHDRTRGLYLHTRVGRNCFVGGRATILPGVEVGDGCVIGTGAVVTKSVPAGSVVAGTPARVLRSGIDVGPYGRFADADATEAGLAEAGLA